MNPPPLPGPPPLPPALSRPSGIVHQIARASVQAPLMGLVVAFIAFAFLRTSSDKLIPLVIAAIAMVLAGVGVICAGIGFVGMSRHGTRGLLGWSLGGFALGGFVLASGFGAIKEVQKAQRTQAALRDIKAASDQYRNDLRRSFDPENGITNTSLDKIDRMKESFDKAAQQSSGSDAAIAKAMSAHFSRTRAAMEKYNLAVEALKAAAVLNPVDLTNRNQFAPRREVVDRFLRANDELKLFVSESENLILADLKRLNVSQRQRDGFMVGYHRKAGEVNLLVLKVRRCDTALGNALLGGLKILEERWGRWDYDTTDEKIKFADDAAVAAYTQVLAAMQDAGAEQVRLQQEIIALQQASP